MSIKLCAFADEASVDLQGQIKALKRNEISSLWGPPEWAGEKRDDEMEGQDTGRSRRKMSTTPNG